jgi:ketosteroid isomerase-like protein
MSELTQRVRAGVDAFNRGDVEAMVSMCTADVEIKRIDGSPDAGHAVRGREATAEWLKPVVFADQHLEVLEIVEGVDVAAARAIFTATGRGSGVEINLEAYIVYRMDGDLVRRIENWRRREDAERAAGLRFSAPG